MQYTDPKFLEKSELLYDLSQLDQAINTLAKFVERDYQYSDEKNRPILVAVMNGALITMGQLLPKINLAVDVDYCHATRYGNNTRGGELNWLVHPQKSVKERHVILVDDIFDEGITLQQVAQYFIDEGASTVKTLVLLDKEHDRKAPNFTVDYSAITIPDRYVFGFGLDYQGSYRNAPGIYALKSEAS